MRTGQGIRLLLAFGIVGIDLVVAARAQDPAATAKMERQKRLDQQFQESLGWYLVSASPASQAPMKPESVLHWTNATRGQDQRHPEPTVILWADAGRPVALASVYPWGTNLVYDCVSLARDVGLTAREDGRTVWSPTMAGVTFRGLSDIQAPATNTRARLTQMKSLAERFKVTMFGLKADQSDREEMRLLPKPIYRYKLDDGKTVHPDLIDGALFAFVQGTDPEAVLLVEAIRQGDRTDWQYAFARATAAGLEARLGPSVVWTAPRIYSSNDPKLPRMVFGRPLVE
jgi:hypothetical protein